MTLTINDTTMTSDRSTHTAPYSDHRNSWEVSWLPGKVMDRNTAVTAMTLPDAAAGHELHERRGLWPQSQNWVGEPAPSNPRSHLHDLPTTRRYQPSARTSQPAARSRGGRLNSQGQQRDQQDSPVIAMFARTDADVP